MQSKKITVAGWFIILLFTAVIGFILPFVIEKQMGNNSNLFTMGFAYVSSMIVSITFLFLSAPREKYETQTSLDDTPQDAEWVQGLPTTIEDNEFLKLLERQDSFNSELIDRIGQNSKNIEDLALYLSSQSNQDNIYDVEVSPKLLR